MASSTMMCPECALAGTVTSSPVPAWRRREAGETLLTRAPGRFREGHDHAFRFQPRSGSSSVPCVETWCGLPLHLLAGTQLTVVIRTLVTCAVVEPVLVPAASSAGWSLERRACRRRSPPAGLCP
jgi:hypothetical protein